MANIRQRKNSQGVITSWQIRVHRGRDLAGSEIKPAVKNLKRRDFPDSWNDAKIQKEVKKKAVIFEQQYKNGFVGSGQQRFDDYALYVLQLKEAHQKHRTVERYKELLERINSAIGHMKLDEIRPQHLNQLYSNLAEAGVRKDSKYTCKVDLKQLLRKSGYTKVRFAEDYDISIGVLNSITQGKNVSKWSAEAVAKGLHISFQKAFVKVADGKVLSAKTILEHHRLISTILAQAEKEMLISYNPAHRATPPKIKKTQANYFQIKEVTKIISCLESEPLKWKAIINLLIFTGCRKGEILGLKWSKIDFDNCTIKIDNTLLYSRSKGIYEDTPKTGKSRAVMLPPEVIKLLKVYRLWIIGEKLASGDRWGNSDYVFVQQTGMPMHPGSIYGWLQKFSARHGLPHINPHAFRHTCASILISKGIDIVTVSKMLGHEKVSTTIDIYAELMEKTSREASECIADVLLR